MPPPTVSDYKGFQIVTPDPIGAGGDMINDNFKKLAAQFPIFGYEIQWSSANPVDILQLPLDRLIMEINVKVTESFDGAGAFFLLGTLADPSAFFTAAETDLTMADVFFNKSFRAGAGDLIRLTLNPGVSPSTGKVFVEIVTVPKP